MAIVQCPNNHYYDDKRNNTCPYCEKLDQGSVQDNSINEQATSYFFDDEDDGQRTEAYGEYVEEYEKTIGIFMDETHNTLTVGWLVVIKGAEKGKSYVVSAGRNFAGSALDADIVLSEDEGIKSKHFSVVYDPKSISFYCVQDEGNTYVNGNVATSGISLKEGDIIQAGESEYMFIPFCKEGRDWECVK